MTKAEKAFVEAQQEMLEGPVGAQTVGSRRGLRDEDVRK